jgi:hypothetical protein
MLIAELPDEAACAKITLHYLILQVDLLTDPKNVQADLSKEQLRTLRQMIESEFK